MWRSPLLFAILLLTIPLFAQHQHQHEMTAESQENTTGVNADAAMSSRHMHEMPHMRMTTLREVRPGDRERADAVLEAARKAMEPYRDYRAAERAGFKIFLPNVPQKMYHFTNYWNGFLAGFSFHPDLPTSLLYEKTSDGFRLIGAMYTAPAEASLEELDSRVPLSIGRWHLHTDFCQAPRGREAEYLGAHAKFGLLGSITTREACEQQGGEFYDHIFGWMVHVYPYEKNPSEVWSVERQMDHGH